MRLHRISTTTTPHGSRRCEVTALLGFAVTFFGCIPIEHVKCLDTIVKDSEYSVGIEEPSDSLLIDDDIAKHIDNKSNFGSSNSHQETSLEDTHDRLWGSSGTGNSAVPLKADTSDNHRTIESTEDIKSEGKHHSGRWGSTQQQASMPVKGKFSDVHINPPEGFALTARVYIDSTDKLAHFDVMEETNGEINSTMKSNNIMLPYYDCGVSGATTAALPVKQIYFRHALSSPTTVYVDQSSIDSKLVLHPVLAIALSSLTVELDSGAHMNFIAGDVILFEDTIRPGHLLTVSKESKNLTVLIITLPNKHLHIGKQYISIRSALTAHPQQPIPCSVSKPSDDSDKKRLNPKFEGPEIESISITDLRLNKSSSLLASSDGFINSASAQFSNAGRRIRIVLLGTIAFSLSTLMADFLGRTAPLWLAVGVGGTCFVVGSTYTITMFSDFLYSTLSLWHERRKLVNQR